MFFEMKIVTCPYQHSLYFEIYGTDENESFKIIEQTIFNFKLIKF